MSDTQLKIQGRRKAAQAIMMQSWTDLVAEWPLEETATRDLPND